MRLYDQTLDSYKPSLDEIIYNKERDYYEEEEQIIILNTMLSSDAEEAWREEYYVPDIPLINSTLNQNYL